MTGWNILVIALNPLCINQEPHSIFWSLNQKLRFNLSIEQPNDKRLFHIVPTSDNLTSGYISRSKDDYFTTKKKTWGRGWLYISAQTCSHSLSKGAILNNLSMNMDLNNHKTNISWSNMTVISRKWYERL